MDVWPHTFFSSDEWVAAYLYHFKSGKNALYSLQWAADSVLGHWLRGILLHRKYNPDSLVFHSTTW